MGMGGSAADAGMDAAAQKYAPRGVQEPWSWLEKVSIAVSIAGWFVFSLASLFFAKHVLHVYKINEGVFTLWQFGSSVAYGLIFTKVLRWRPLAVLTRRQMNAVIPLSAAFLVKEVLKYASLARVSVNLVNTIRSLGPLFNVCLEFLFFRHRPQPSVLWSLLPIILGVALTSVDEIHSASGSGIDILISMLGFCAAVLSTAINNGQNIYSKILFGKERIDPVSLQIYLSAISLLIMSPFSLSQLIYHAFTSEAPTRHYFAPSLPVAAFMALAGLVNFVASQLAFSTLNKISPLSYSVANTFKRVCIAVVAIFYFNEHLSPINFTGIAISIAGVFVYERSARAYKEARMYRKVPSSDNDASANELSLPVRRQTGSELDLVATAMQGSFSPQPTQQHQTIAMASPLSPMPSQRVSATYASVRAQ